MRTMRHGHAALPADGHVHSQWSWDALAGSMEGTCARAAEIGLPALAFTEHAQAADLADTAGFGAGDDPCGFWYRKTRPALPASVCDRKRSILGFTVMVTLVWGCLNMLPVPLIAAGFCERAGGSQGRAAPAQRHRRCP
jgi:hypothetical protein